MVLLVGGWIHVISVGVAVTATATAAVGVSSSSVSWLAMSSSSVTSSSSRSGGDGGGSGSPSFVYRKSTLIPWSSTRKGTNSTGHGGGGGESEDCVGTRNNIISLGTCIERRRQDVVLRQDGNDSDDEEDTENDNDGGRAVLRCTVQIHNDGNNENDSDDPNGNKNNETTLLDVDLPEGRSEGSDGGLASQLWPSALASAILLASPEFCEYLNDHHDEDREGDGDDDDDDDVTLSEEDSRKPSIVRSTERRKKLVVELGSGRGLAGLVASKIGAECILTDNDEEAVELLKDAVVMLNNDNNDSLLLQTKEEKAAPRVQYMDWRDNESGIDDDNFPIPVDMVFGSDIAYYWYLLRPIMDTTMRLFGKRIEEEEIGGGDDSSGETAREERSNSHGGRGVGGMFVVVGQANRQSQWDLYKNIRDGCYNQLTDKNEPPWEGSTNMILYNLQMSEFCESLEDCDKCIDGTVPIAVLVHQNFCDSNGAGDNDFDDSTIRPSTPFLPFGSAYAHIATDEDDENILKSF